MANGYSISWCTFKWMKELIFHLLDLAILNSYIVHFSCRGKKISHRDFRFTLMRNMLAHAGPEQRIPMCKARVVAQKIFVRCKCEVELCVKKKKTYFEDYHTNAEL